MIASVGVVVIGRNEGERLSVCVRTLNLSGVPIVYVDSLSSDGSAEAVAKMGIPVIRLDESRPLSAARARNEGFEWMRASNPSIQLVQFVDGDCEVVAGWLEAAANVLTAEPSVAIVCGRVRERYPERSVYNRLCDIEFSREPGEVRSCGGIFMASASAFNEVGGFNPAVVAGEEPELCFRLRAAGYKVKCLDVPMALHDSAMMRFRQWWRRTVRSGVAYAQGYTLHGRSPERFCRSQIRSIVFWVLMPIVTVAAAWPSGGLSLLFLFGIPLQAARIAWKHRGLAGRRGDRWLYGVACMAAKPPQAMGVIKFAWLRAHGRTPSIVEHRAAIRAESPIVTPASTHVG